MDVTSVLDGKTSFRNTRVRASVLCPQLLLSKRSDSSSGGKQPGILRLSRMMNGLRTSTHLKYLKHASEYAVNYALKIDKTIVVQYLKNTDSHDTIARCAETSTSA